MATPGQMVSLLSEVLGVPKVEVLQHDRNLAAAGLRRKGGRGRSAANMNAEDAANLLICVAASTTIKDSVETTSRYCGLRNWGWRGSVTGGDYALDKTKWGLEEFEISALKNLPTDHSFGDAITNLIGAASDGSLVVAWAATKSESGIEPTFDESGPRARIEVKLFSPIQRASICIRDGNFFEEKHYKMRIDNDGARSNYFRSLHFGTATDLKQIRQFSHRSIFSLGELIAGYAESF